MSLVATPSPGVEGVRPFQHLFHIQMWERLDVPHTAVLGQQPRARRTRSKAAVPISPGLYQTEPGFAA